MDNILTERLLPLHVEAFRSDWNFSCSKGSPNRFYKLYDFSKGDTVKDIKRDLRAYSKGDITYLGTLNESTGEVYRPTINNAPEVSHVFVDPLE